MSESKAVRFTWPLISDRVCFRVLKHVRFRLQVGVTENVADRVYSHMREKLPNV